VIFFGFEFYSDDSFQLKFAKSHKIDNIADIFHIVRTKGTFLDNNIGGDLTDGAMSPNFFLPKCIYSLYNIYTKDKECIGPGSARIPF
jgi:hypothetical protein